MSLLREIQEAALFLLSAGINPQRPPQEQVEEANRQKKIKKDSESGDPKD